MLMVVHILLRTFRTATLVTALADKTFQAATRAMRTTKSTIRTMMDNELRAITQFTLVQARCLLLTQHPLMQASPPILNCILPAKEARRVEKEEVGTERKSEVESVRLIKTQRTIEIFTFLIKC